MGDVIYGEPLNSFKSTKYAQCTLYRCLKIDILCLLLQVQNVQPENRYFMPTNTSSECTTSVYSDKIDKTQISSHSLK